MRLRPREGRRSDAVQTIYLDFNTTTPLAPSVLEAMQPFWSEYFLLPGQDHQAGRAVCEGLDRAREGVAELLQCDSFELVFTDGGTEANNLAVLGQAGRHRGGHVLVSVLEHESVRFAADVLTRRGWQVETFPCRSDGLVDPQEVVDRLRPKTRLVCLQAANPVLGTLQPVGEVADACHRVGVPLHCDATQLFGKVPIDIQRLRADTLAISGHKFYGPKGTGALYVRRGMALQPTRFGESREMGLRPGTENVTGWVGLGAAAALSARAVGEAADRLGELKERFIQQVRELIDPMVQVACEDSPCLPNTATLLLPLEAKRIQRAAHRLVVTTARSRVPADPMTRALAAVGCTNDQIEGAIRFSFGWTTSQDQVDRAAELLAEAWDREQYRLS